MKTLFSLLILLSTSMVFSAVCDLSENNRRIDKLNRQFDEGQMRGEYHLIGLTRARRDRVTLIETCLTHETIEGLSKEDLLAAKEEIQLNLVVAVEDFRVQIEFEISMDRIGMATELMMERDLEKLRVSNLVALIDYLASKSILRE